MQVLFQNAQTTGEAEWAEPLRDDHGAGVRILFQQFGNRGIERIQLAGALPGSGPARRCRQVLGDGSPSQVQMTSDLAHRPVLGPVQAMNRVDLFCGQHAAAPRYTTGSGPGTRELFLASIGNGHRLTIK